MTQYVIPNNINTTLASALPSSSTTIVLASSANLPTLSAGQIMPITLNDEATGLNYEICYVTAISGTSLTVTRAQEGTSALNWNVGDYAFCAFTSGTTAVSTGNPNNTFQVANATLSQQSLPLGQAVGRLLNIQIFSVVGSSTYTPHAGATAVYVRVQGGGGSGGGCAATGSGQIFVGSGGTAGAYAESWITSGFSGVTVTVGAGGAAVSGFNSSNGGTSSFGSLVSAPGGAGGTGAGPTAPPWATGAASSSIATGGSIFNASGQSGQPSVGYSATFALPGSGGPSAFGAGGGTSASGANGAGAASRGAGGGGSAQTQSAGALSGGAGGSGLVLVYEYGTI
ncbi:hypothetical protein BLA6863_00140 [Burkholderia lata]|uniref:Glycine-rich domain-containing protein n=1 Tax=Burkholderia lata (strain ATCC 17760 / DSM 23089 / LMG 22485 / NCIMB 9086 / R18194 / 383) TaxID=482957 RepID=A0A6P2GR98_BURL3|nr:hypothetical protein BLA6863_00140 [Burkholderia lata]